MLFVSEIKDSENVFDTITTLTCLLQLRNMVAEKERKIPGQNLNIMKAHDLMCTSGRLRSTGCVPENEMFPCFPSVWHLGGVISLRRVWMPMKSSMFIHVLEFREELGIIWKSALVPSETNRSK